MRESRAQSAVLTAVLTVMTLVAFAANSVLCRLALGEDVIDPWSFTAVRLGTGAVALLLLTVSRRPSDSQVGGTESGEGGQRQVSSALSGSERRGNWRRAGYLVLYALPFSLAYVDLDAGTGALLLFGAVQLTMITLGIVGGERPRPIEWLALGGAAAGMVYFVLPGVSAPDPVGAALMLAAGIGWGYYSIAGKGAGDPATVTAAAFWRAALVAIGVAALAFSYVEISPRGAILATISGALTSGVGYVIWYAALRGLLATQAALVQLAVPVIAAAAGVALLGEAATSRLMIASVVILGSIAMGVLARRRAARV